MGGGLLQLTALALGLNVHGLKFQGDLALRVLGFRG